MICHLICFGVHGQSDETTEAPTCNCMDACSAYTDDKYNDCTNFCSYYQEPLPRCMCDKNYMTAKNRRILAFKTSPVSILTFKRNTENTQSFILEQVLSSTDVSSF
jgi:hypothetical protein